MLGENRSHTNIGDPYAYLALEALKLAFNDIRAYYFNKGTETEIREGKKTVRWIREMRGNFRLLVSATEVPLEDFHQKCLLTINRIEREARERQRVCKQVGTGPQS